jgi:signal transduction histidine kinase
VSAGTGDAPDVSIAREGDFVRVSVALGPEAASATRTERAWLSRMALRYGGQLELEGGQELLVLPAEGVEERNEVEALRKELVAAQQQGEAYARELAAVFAAGDSAEMASVSPSSSPPPTGTIAAISALSTAIAAQLRSVLTGLARDLESAGFRSIDPPAVGDALQLVQTRIKEIQSDLGRLGKVVPTEQPAVIDVVAVVRQQLEEADSRAHRHGVHVDADLPGRLVLLAPPTTLRALVRLLVDHAIAATPREGRILVRVAERRQAVVVTVEDAGPSVPAGARDALVWRRIDPATVGRPHGVHLLSAAAILSDLGGLLEVDDAPGGGTRAIARIPLP